MMSTVITGLFDDDERADRAVRELEAASVPSEDISLIASNKDNRWNGRFLPGDENRGDAVGAGASIGGVIGGGAGLMAGLGIVAIPGLGPVVAAGWLAPTATGAVAGAATGGIIGMLLGAGISRDEAQIDAESIKRGGAVVAVRTADALAQSARAILVRCGAVDPDERIASYRAGGWTRFEETSAPFAGREQDGEDRPVRYSDMLRH
jgi:hypothetical protein